MSKLFVCGDIVNKFSEKQFIDAPLLDVIESSDYAVANLEGPVAGKGTVIQDTGICQNGACLTLLKKSGFDLLLLANNHMGDLGKKALIQTKEAITRLGMECIGAGTDYNEIYQPLVVHDIAGRSFCFINLSEAQPYHYHSKEQTYGYAWIGDRNIKERISYYRDKVDYIVTFIHAGLEHYTTPLKYFREYYHWLVDSGVDAVVGGHPHIAQGIEYYRDKPIVYSLGNFYFHPYRDESLYSIYENNGYSILMDFNDKGITCDIFYHRRKGFLVEMIPESEAPLSVKQLSEDIISKQYESMHEEMIRASYERLVSPLYRNCLHTTSSDDDLILKLKTAILYLLFPKRYRGNQKSSNRTFAHLLNNETYRAIVSEYFRSDYAGEND